MPRIAKRLVGEELGGFEGVNYYLLKCNGSWTIRDSVLQGQTMAPIPQADVRGTFARPPKARLLAGASQGGYRWIENGIQAMTPTDIVYVIKSLEDWQQEGLSAMEVERLSAIAGMAISNSQLLVGANIGLLEAGSDVVQRVLEQAQEAGGWRVFVNEHMWFEIMPLPVGSFSLIVYGEAQPELGGYPFTI